MVAEGLSRSLPGGIIGRLKGEFWSPLPFCCGPFTGLTFFARKSPFDCVTMLAGVCFLPGGTMGFLGPDEGAGEWEEGGVGASLTGRGAGGVLFP